jgi:hypothetical protein
MILNYFTKQLVINFPGNDKSLANIFKFDNLTNTAVDDQC